MNSFRSVKDITGWGSCAFCGNMQEGARIVYLHSRDVDRDEGGNIVKYEHYDNFCNEACFNCFVLKNNCKKYGWGYKV